MKLIGIVTGGVMLVLAGFAAIFDYRMTHRGSKRPPEYHPHDW